MKVVYMGFLCPTTGEREERDGFTIGNLYDAQPETWGGERTGWILFDEYGARRRRPLNDCEEVPFLRRAWARFPSLQSIFA